MKLIKWNSVLFLVLFSAIFQIVQAEQTSLAVENGKLEFYESCSLCHGKKAKGDGLFSKMLTIETPDLTQLKRNNGGNFPYREVYLIVDGREPITQHGPRQMPIWGDRFKSTTWYTVNQNYAETLVTGKIFEVLLYLDSIQEE